MQTYTKSTLKNYWRHAWAYPWYVVIIILGALIAIALEMYRAFIIKGLFDALNQGVDHSDVALYFLIFWSIISIVRVSFWRIVNYTVNRLRAFALADIIRDSFTYLHDHSYRFFSENFVGSLVTKVKRFEASFLSLIKLSVYDLGRTAITCLSIIGILFYYKPIFGLVALVWAILFIGANLLFVRYKLPIDVQKSQVDSEVTANLADTITNNINIKIFGGRSREKQKFWAVTEKHKNLRRFLWNINTHFNIFQAFSMIALEFTLFYLGIRLWEKGHFSVGDFALLQIYMLRMFDMLWNLGEDLLTAYEAVADAAEMTEIFETKHEVIDKPNAKVIKVTQGRIDFQNINFSYGSESEVLNNFNVTISPGEKVALIGPSGGGKTTIVKILFRLFDIQSGAIKIDGQDISDVTQESLRANISLVPQEPILFHRSLFENIAYAKPGATEAEVYRAAKLAHCHEFISHYKDGYNTFVGERGIKLSGGERQRVAIARAILKDAPILVLDEATSSLDSESERLIQDSLRKLMKDKTVLVVAHRLSTIMQMDRIIVIESGKIIETGTHEQLLKLEKGTYQKLWQIQAGSFATN